MVMTNVGHRAASLVLLIVTAATLVAGAPAHAATPYDGAWSVLIMTDQGTCDRAYRYALRISNGQVLYGGDGGGPARISGRVNRGGRVVVSVASGQGSAIGSGRLSAAGGSGRWRGAGSQATCAGRWVAERRG
jgi:hypothetical protein